jgi:hypothetical protein
VEMMLRPRGLVVLALLAALGVAPAAGSAVAEELRGTTGPGFTITLQNAAGTQISRLDPGTYDLTVRDESIDHNFHIYGPGVEEATSVDAVQTVTWAVTFREGRYTYLCDLHPTQMVKELVVGNPPPPAPSPSPSPTPTPKPKPKLLATVGPNATISLRNAKGTLLKTVKRGTYSVVVRDRTKAHNFHLVGKGVNKKSTVAFTGTVTWTVKLSAGVLRFYSDRAPTKVKGSVRVT